MKRHRIVPTSMLLLVLTFTASLASAAFNIPNHVYTIDQLRQAKEEARADDKQIVFLFSDEHTTCALCTRASINIMRRFERRAVIVYFGKKDWAKAPRIVTEAINSPEAGKFIPKTIVVDSGITEVVSIIPYERAVE